MNFDSFDSEKASKGEVMRKSQRKIVISLNNNKRKPEKNGKKMCRRIVGLCIILVAAYLIAALVSSIAGNLSTTTALSGTVTEGFRTDGYVFREQTVITAPCTGYLECMVSDGDRVSEGQVIGYIYSNAPDPAIIKEIKELSAKLAVAQVSGSEVSYAADEASGKTDLSTRVRNMSDIRTKRNIKTFSVKAKEVSDEIKRSGNGEYKGKTADEIRNEIDSLNQGLGVIQEVKSEKGGVFCPRTDGFEDALTYDKAKDATPKYLDELDDMSPVISQTVEAGYPLCKIINNYDWYFVARTDKKTAATLKEGQSVELEFFNLSDSGVTGTVSKISAEENGEVAVIISTNKYVKGIYSVNKINCEIVRVSVSGIKLPVSCIRVQDGREGVFAVRLDRATFVPVSVRYKNDEWVIVSPIEETGKTKLKIYDEVIVDAKSVEDNKLVR